MAIFNPNVQLEIIKAVLAENVFEVPLTLDNVKFTNFSHGPSSSMCDVEGVRYSGLKSFRRVKYHRISIAELFKNVKLVVEAPECKTTKDLLPMLGAVYGLFLTEADIVDKPISWLDPEQDYIYECVLEIKPNHPMYYGTVKVSVSGILLDIGKVLVVTDVDGIADTSVHDSKQNVTMTTYGIDYSAHSEWFRDKIRDRETAGGYDSISEPVAKELAKRLSAMDGLPWTYGDNVKEFNLKGATVAAHTVTSNFDKHYPLPHAQPNQEYQRVLLIAHSAKDANNNYTRGWGYFIHYDVIGRID